MGGAGHPPIPGCVPAPPPFRTAPRVAECAFHGYAPREWGCPKRCLLDSCGRGRAALPLAAHFYGGFALLPWLWGVSVLFYRHRAYEPDAHPELRRCACCCRSCRIHRLPSPPRVVQLADAFRGCRWTTWARCATVVHCPRRQHRRHPSMVYHLPAVLEGLGLGRAQSACGRRDPVLVGARSTHPRVSEARNMRRQGSTRR